MWGNTTTKGIEERHKKIRKIRNDVGLKSDGLKSHSLGGYTVENGSLFMWKSLGKKYVTGPFCVHCVFPLKVSVKKKGSLC